MADVKRTVTQTRESGINEGGAPVSQQTKRIQTQSAVDAKTTVQNVIWYILGFVEILLALRLVLKLLGANPASSFVNLVYNVSGVLSAPFDSIFGVTQSAAGPTHSVFEPSIVVAVVVYALVAWGIVKLVTINQNK